MSAPSHHLRPALRSGTAALCLAAAVLLAGCGSEPADPEAPSGPTTSAAMPSASATANESASSQPSASASASSPAATDVVIDISLADGKTVPSGQKIDVSKGQTVRLNITADHDDAVHVHGDYDLEVEVTPGRSVSKSFVADSTGSVEVESHHPEKIIAILNIR